MSNLYDQDRVASSADALVPSVGGRDPGAVWRVALLLAAVIVGLLVVNNWHYIFQAKLYESGDWASDSLMVRDAKSGVLLHGHYSRWNFYHPGPAVLDVLALGETVFFDWLHVVPTPFNGQTLGNCISATLFFSFALAVFARRLGRGRGGYTFFLPLALLFAIWHYGSAQAGAAFLETWPVCPPILTFLCFLVAVASTASGGGRELPLVVVAGGWLVHNYVAQPLFVVPLTLLAYGGLLWWCRQNRPAGDRQGWGSTLAAGWRAFPRAHWIAAALLALFILPLLIDALHGRASNLDRILTHVRNTHEPHKKLLRSLCYFLVFGGYDPYDPTKNYLARYSAVGMLDFVALHWRVYLCWLLTLLAPPVLFAASRRSTPAQESAGARPTPSTFVPWYYVTLAGSLGLTLIWGMKQDGDMFYFNAFFNYSIYYGAALGLAGALAVFLQALAASPGLVRARRVICAALWLGVGAAAVDGAAHFRCHDVDFPVDREAARVVSAAAVATLPPGGVCFLECRPWGIWPAAIAVALQLERLGYQVRVHNAWEVMFGRSRTLAAKPVDLTKRIVRWRVTPIAPDPSRLGRWPVLMDCGIEVLPLIDINPADGSILFGADGNYTGIAISGWAPSDSDWTYSDQPDGLMQFRPLPVSDDAKSIDMVINAWSFVNPDHPQSQRVETTFGGVKLETIQLPVEGGTLETETVHIDAALWRDAVAHGIATLQFHFPDARSPLVLGLSADTRPIAGGFRSIAFRVTEPAAAETR